MKTWFNMLHLHANRALQICEVFSLNIVGLAKVAQALQGLSHKQANRAEHASLAGKKDKYWGTGWIIGGRGGGPGAGTGRGNGIGKGNGMGMYLGPGAGAGGGTIHRPGTVEPKKQEKRTKKE